jgi:phosphoglycolate phosphatase
MHKCAYISSAVDTNKCLIYYKYRAYVMSKCATRKRVKVSKIVIFDMDGTVLDTIAYTVDVMNASLRDAGYIKLPDERLEGMLGVSIREMSEKLLEFSGETVDKENSEKMSRCIYNNIFNWDSYRPIEVFQGIKELLYHLKSLNYKIALLSNTPHEPVKYLAEKYFPKLFDCVYGEGGDIERKPSTKGVKIVINELRGKKENTILVGDSKVDIETARNARVDIIGVTWGVITRDDFVKAGVSMIASSTEELMKNIDTKFNSFQDIK